jgi:hypothetical protein
MARFQSSSRDILRSHGAIAAVYGLPILAIVGSGSLAPASMWHQVIWFIALTTMGLACTVNALRCGRVHCYVTGPLLLMGALVVLLDALAIVHIGRTGWNVLCGALIVGTLFAYCVVESALGRYRRTS